MNFRAGKIRVNCDRIAVFFLFLGMICLVYTHNILNKVIVVLFLSYSLMLLLGHRHIFTLSKLSVAYIGWLVWASLSSIWAYREVNIKIVLIILLYVLITLALPQFFNDERDFVFLAKTIVLATLLLAVFRIAFAGLNNLISNRLTNDIINSNRFGMNIAYATVFCLYLGDKNYKRYLLLILPWIFFIMISGSKSAVLSFVLMVFTYCVCKNRINSKAFIKTVLASIVLLACLLFFLRYVDWAYEILGKRLFGLFSAIFLHTEAGYSTDTRLDMIYDGLAFANKSPLWGYGLDNYKFLYGETNGWTVYAHNTYIEILVDLGIIGLVIYYVPRLYVMKRVMKRLYQNKEEFALAMALIMGMLFLDFVSVNINETYEQCLLIIIYLLSLRLRRGILEGGCYTQAGNSQ